MKVNRYFLYLAYDGTAFHGWQSQNNACTVQSYLNETLSMMLGLPVKLTGAGRTDTGVHARCFYAHFDLESVLTPEMSSKLIFKLNRYLSPAIAIYDIIPVRNEAHARFSALSRTYKYYINTLKDTFTFQHSLFYSVELDIELMNEAGKKLTGTHDFTSFSKVDSDTKTNICTISEAYWTDFGKQKVLTITADRFLRNMVRAITGTMIQVGRHKITIPEFIKIIECRDRSLAGDSAPAKGLFLEQIQYPADIWL